MCFAAVHHTEVVMQLSMLWAALSLADQSILGRLPVDAPQAGVVGEMVARFEEQEEWCSHIETSDSRVCDLILGLADGHVPLVAYLKEVVGPL
jgi:hypothetical protein